MAIRLTVLRQAETYIFSLDLPSQPLSSGKGPASWSVGGMTTLSEDVRGQLNETINAAVERLRRRYVGSRRKRETSASLLRLGQFLFNFLLPPALQNALRDLPEQNIPIILTTNDTELPWELLHDGMQYLTLKHPIARRLWSATPLRPKPMPESGSSSFLLITNPTEDLAEADNESDDLMDLFERELISGASLKILARRRANWLRVSQALGGHYDIIHYSGHAERGVLLLHDGELTTQDIERTLQGHPFVFLNACWSSREAAQVNRAEALDYAGVTIRNMAQAFILAGSAGFIGTLWPVFDHSSRHFAEYFYTHVLDGVSVGEALRRTREQMKEEHPDDPVWASFVYYGNPQLTLAKAPPEKRYVTVLVAQLTGMALLFEALPLEAAVEMKEQVLLRLKGIVERYDGRQHAPVTDMLAVYFGIPLMTGNEAEVAIRAAREMTQALRDFGKFNQPSVVRKRASRSAIPQLSLRIGISTGHVLYRPPQVEGTEALIATRANGQIMGQLENVAAVGIAQAKPGQIMVDQATYQSARNTFSFEHVERLESSETTVPPFYRVIGVNVPTRSEFVGREKEVDQLQGFWRQARKGRRQIISIVGEPGVGKTRLLQAFREQITGDHLWISAICHNHDKSQSYSLLAQIIRTLAQFEPHDDDVTQRRKLEELVRNERGSQHKQQRKDKLALLGNVIGLPVAVPEIKNLDQALPQKLLARAVQDVLKSQSAQQPLVLALEDLQSADQDSLTVLEQVVKGRQRMRLLLLAVYRPSEWSHNWGDRVQANIRLEELPSDAQLTMLTNLFGLEPSAELAQVLLKQTGGNPLFIEEYVRFLQEGGFLSASGDVWTANLSDIPLLNKVEAVIQARLSKLDDESRQALHTAAIIGQKFEEQVLYEVQENRTHQPPDKQEIIEELTHRRLIEEWEEEWDSDSEWEEQEDSEWHDFLLFYVFRHGLVHQIASALFPDSLLQTIHRLVAQALLIVYRDEEKILSRLADHYYHSHDRVKAIRYGLRAAKKDAERWANQGALQWYARSLEKISSFSEEPASEKEQKEGATVAQRLAWHVDALEGQADVLSTMGQTGSSIPSYTRALELAAGREPVARLANLFHKLAVQQQSEGQFDLAQDTLNQGLELLDGQASIEASIEAGKIHVYAGFIGYRRGHFGQALADSQKGLAMLEKTGRIRDLAQAYNLQGLLYRSLGESQKGIEAHDQSVALYKQADYLPGLERASYNRACLYRDLGKWQEALDSFEESRLLSQRTGEARRQAAALNGQSVIYLFQGKLEQAIDGFTQVAQLFDALGSEEFLATALMNLGVSYFKKSALERHLTEHREAQRLREAARNHLEKSLAMCQRLKANQHLPRILYNLAQLELLCQQPTNALHLAQEAAKLVLQQGNRQQEGEIKRTLGQAYRELGQLDLANHQLEESLTILEERHLPHETGLTLVELARLRKVQGDDEDGDRWRKQAIAYCDRAIAIFNSLGAALDLEQAQQIRHSL